MSTASADGRTRAGLAVRPNSPGDPLRDRRASVPQQDARALASVACLSPALAATGSKTRRPDARLQQRTDTDTRGKAELKPERPRLHKVILVNDDFTPREFVVTVLRKVFSLTDGQAHRVMVTAHTRGACVVAVYTKDIAETRATEATEMGRSKGHPLMFTTEPEE